MNITTNKFVSAEYELYVDAETEGAELELMERATEDQPLEFIFGAGMMLPKFEQMLEGLEAGQLFEFTLQSDEAYGDFIEENVIDLDRAVFEIDGKFDSEMIFEGNIVPLMDTEGNRMSAAILEVTDTKVKVDLNHPLAGETLHFKGKILEVREPSPQELAAVMGGGGCGGGGCGSDSDEKKSGCGGCG